MNFKINTSEKFTTVTPEIDSLTDSITSQLIKQLKPYLTKEVHNVVLNMKNIKHCSAECVEKISDLQQDFYENNASLVLCEVQPLVYAVIEKLEMEDVINMTPTESEAWDILQMEEIERELLDEQEPLFNDFEEEEEEDYED